MEKRPFPVSFQEIESKLERERSKGVLERRFVMESGKVKDKWESVDV